MNLFQPKDRANEQTDIYDPAFYLPMFVSMFAPSEIIYTYRTCQSGCFSLILSALSSHHKDVRITAFVTLQRFHSHLLRFVLHHINIFNCNNFKNIQSYILLITTGSQSYHYKLLLYLGYMFINFWSKYSILRLKKK